MRRILKKHSTSAERKMYEVLKELKIPFKHRWIVQGREVDFLIDKYAIEIDGHEQDTEKNNMLVKNGYIPIHLQNIEITKKNIKLIIKNYEFNKIKST